MILKNYDDDLLIIIAHFWRFSFLRSSVINVSSSERGRFRPTVVDVATISLLLGESTPRDRDEDIGRLLPCTIAYNNMITNG